MYATPKEASKIYQVTDKTLRRWAKNGEIEYTTTKGGHHRYRIFKNTKRKKFIYARVSSKKQSSDLKRQISFLTEKYPKYTVVKDIGSGINFKRKGLKRILEQLFARNISEIVVYSKDRLSRFSNDLLEYMFKFFGAKITYENIHDTQTPTEEFAEDVMSIITVFTARYHGSRKYKSNKKNKNISI